MSREAIEVMENTERFVESQENSSLEMRKLIKRLFELAESMAAKEINSNPQEFVQREVVS